VIFSARRGGPRDEVLISISHDADDEAITRTVPRREVVDPDDPHQFLRIPTDAGDTAIAEAMAELEAALPDLELKVSTGPVVDFRAKEFLRLESEGETVPLIYPHNVRGGRLEWPRETGRKKPQAIVAARKTMPMFLPNESYVVVKRFSSKEERRRVSAAHTLPSDLPASEVVAFENHLNVFHRNKAGFPEDLARGLAGYLNSSFVDRYVRVFSGHTQINATDLRQLRYPKTDILISLGVSLGNDPCQSQDELDRRVGSLVPALEGFGNGS
jgi:adenine-specific DNA-methyltransferase